MIGEASFEADRIDQLDPAVERLLVDSRERQSARPRGRERSAELGAALSFLAAATIAALALPADGPMRPGLAVATVLAYALAARVEFHVGASWAVPTELVLVPMLFLVPLPYVPLLVAAALVIAKLPEYLRRQMHPERAIVSVGIAWYSLGPVLVLSLTGAGGLEWSDWPLYLAALAAQFAIDAAVSTSVCRIGLGVPVRPQLAEVGAAAFVDAMLAPIGLLVAFACLEQPYAFIAVMPLVGLMGYFAREREARIQSALRLSDAYRGTALLLAELLSADDEYTGDHSRSVVVLASEVAERLGLNERQKRDLEFGALLHDVGKITVPKEILHKPGRLTASEFEVMKQHVVQGQRMLERVGGALREAGYVIRTHHERYDGRGYPDGLDGEEIPLASRIIAACDAFNAMITDRPYRDAMSTGDAVAELRANAGTQFDPGVVGQLVALVETSPDLYGAEEAIAL